MSITTNNKRCESSSPTTSTKKNVPSLRFTEFCGVWKKTKLGKVFDVTSGTTPLRGNKSYFENAQIKWVKTTDLNNGLISDTEEYISQNALENTSIKILPINTVFVAMYGGFNQIGRTGLLTVEATCNQALSAIYPNKHINPYYLLTYLNFNVLKWRRLSASSRKDPNITKSDVLFFPFSFPSLEEQNKIADFIKLLDSKANVLQEKHSQLQQYKKGVMQQLFSQKLRFTQADGCAYPDWEEKKLGDVFNWIKTNSFSRADLQEMGNIQNIHYGDIHTNFSSLFNQSKEKVPFLDKDIENSVNENDFCKVGDIVIADASEDYKDIGRAIEIISVSEKPLVAGLHTYIARPIEKFATGFLTYQFQSKKVRLQIQKIAQGVSVLGISKSNLEKINLPIPHQEEQQKIAECLMAIDAKIDAVADQLASVQAFKKGLLQKMFV